MASLIASALTIYAIGSSSRVFDEHGQLTACFQSTDDLNESSYISIAGMDVGRVEAIRLMTPQEQAAELVRQRKRREMLRPLLLAHLQKTSEKPLEEKELEQRLPAFLRKGAPFKKPHLCVRFRLAIRFFPWIGQDSLATLKGRGFLGRAVIELSPSQLVMGNAKMAVQKGQEIQGEVIPNFIAIIADIGQLAYDINQTIRLMNQILSQLNDPKLSRDLLSITEHIEALLREANNGKGLVRDLFYARDLARQARLLLAEIQATIRTLADTGMQVSQILEQMQQRDTLTHRLFFSFDGRRLLIATKEILSGTQKTVRALSLLLKAPQKRGTFIHRLLYDPKAATMLKHFREITADLNVILKRLQKGRGSLGALLYDATAYEDLKIVLKNLKDSSLVQFIINIMKTDEEKR
jgi:ABC-type transporter Mla subunit MlaD